MPAPFLFLWSRFMAKNARLSNVPIFGRLFRKLPEKWQSKADKKVEKAIKDIGK